MPEDFWIRNTKFCSFRRTLREEECGKHLKTSPGWLPALKPTVASGLTRTLWMACLRSSATEEVGFSCSDMPFRA